MSNLAWGAVGVGASVVAGVVGAYRGGRAGRWLAEATDADLQQLRAGLPLPPLPEPAAPAPRRLVHLAICWAGGILGGGFLVWLVATFSVYALAGGAETWAQRLLLALMFGGMLGLVGFLIPGVPLALVWHATEMRARLRYFEALVAREYWERRERLRGDLASGVVPVDAAIRQLETQDMVGA